VDYRVDKSWTEGGPGDDWVQRYGHGAVPFQRQKHERPSALAGPFLFFFYCFKYIKRSITQLHFQRMVDLVCFEEDERGCRGERA
jgi:hypothetical protein